jgi:hypothetical protein
VSKISGQIEEMGAKVLVVSFARPDKVAAFLEKHPQPFPVVCDPTLTAYRELQMKRTTWLTFFRPDVTARFLKMMVHGQKLAKPDPADDLLQLGGDFALASDRRLIYSHPSVEATDRPTNDDLLSALRSANASRS